MSYYSLPSLFSFISYFLLSLYLFLHCLKKNRSPINWLFLFTASLLAYYSFSIFISHNLYNPGKAYLWIRASYLALIYLLPFLILSIYYFIYNRLPRILYLLFLAVYIIIFHLFLASDFLFLGVERTFYGFRELRGEVYAYFLAGLFLFEIMIIITFLKGFKKIVNPLKRKQLYFLFCGTAFIFIISAVIQIVLPFLGHYEYFFGYFSFTFFLTSFLIWYLIIRYKFLGIDLLIHKGGIYLLLTGIFIFVYIITVEALLPYKKNFLYNYLLFLLTSSFFSVLYVKFSKKIRTVLYKFFFKNEYYVNKSMIKLNEELLKCNDYSRFKQKLLLKIKNLFDFTGAVITEKIPGFINSEILNSSSVLYIKDYLELDLYDKEKYPQLLDYLNKQALSGLIVFRHGGHIISGIEFQNKKNEVLKLYKITILSSFIKNISLKYSNLKLNEELTEKKHMEITQSITSSIIHDIKNIITQLNLYTQNINKIEFNKELNEMMASSFCSSLLKLQKIKNKLLFTGAMSEKKEIKKIDRFLENYIKQNSFIFKDIKISHDLRSGVSLYTDFENLRFILDNILLNAADSITQKNTPGEVIIKTCQKDNSLFLRIKDNGAGLTPVEIKKLLKPFSSKKEKGLGLGLYASWKLLKKDGAGFYILSKKNEYAEIVIQFPLTNKKTEEASLAKKT